MRALEVGDVSGELAVRERLQCKPFKWFMENVAPDILKNYPPYDPEDFAIGTLRSVLNDQCVEHGGRNSGDVTLQTYHEGWPKQFAWCWRKFVRVPNEQFCLESGQGQGRSPTLTVCVNVDPPPMQRWKYDPLTKQLQDNAGTLCLEAETSRQAVMSPCVEGNSKQQWEFQQVNMDRIREVFPEIR